MLLKQLRDRIKMTAVLAGTACLMTAPALAQGFYFPDASFFSPFASYYQSEENEEAVELDYILQEYPDFYSRLQQVSLLESLQDREYLTILMPSEKAFAALSPSMKWKLAQPENMEKLLQYHVIVGEISEQDIKRRSVASALAKNSIEIAGIPQGNKIGVKLNEATATEPIRASDGMIIPIDRVLIPAELR